jgi:hypothetical protein
VRSIDPAVRLFLSASMPVLFGWLVLARMARVDCQFSQNLARKQTRKNQPKPAFPAFEGEFWRMSHVIIAKQSRGASLQQGWRPTKTLASRVSCAASRQSLQRPSAQLRQNVCQMQRRSRAHQQHAVHPRLLCPRTGPGVLARWRLDSPIYRYRLASFFFSSEGDRQ